WLEAAAARHHTVLDVHIKADSGMGRIGVRSEKELLAVASMVRSAKHLNLSGVFTHFASADDEDFAYTREQAARFDAFAQSLKRVQPDILAHASNSAALLRCDGLAYDMVRAGIALYVDPRLPENSGHGLGQAMRWVTRAVQVKEIAPGEPVSYGRRFVARRPTRVMTLPVGYADGYHCAIGGRGRALVRGRSAPVIGRVCMDQIMLDVTDIPGASVGDEAVLLGGQGAERISVREMGEWCGMIDYEILLSPTWRVPKVYVRDAG
ncbi:MAG: alanine racemase, partial [Firmicutes bacterium]|nr:alanine racemase [Bacillota bacterium]